MLSPRSTEERARERNIFEKRDRKANRVSSGSTLLIAVIFIVPCAVAKNIGTLLVCRAIDGIAFSAPMTLVGGTLADLWRNEERGVPMAAFSAAPFLGPASEFSSPS